MTPLDGLLWVGVILLALLGLAALVIGTTLLLGAVQYANREANK